MNASRLSGGKLNSLGTGRRERRLVHFAGAEGGGSAEIPSHVAITGAVGRRVVITALVIREYFVQPSLVRNAL